MEIIDVHCEDCTQPVNTLRGKVQIRNVAALSSLHQGCTYPRRQVVVVTILYSGALHLCARSMKIPSCHPSGTYNF
jgi:hypothetical protein